MIFLSSCDFKFQISIFMLSSVVFMRFISPVRGHTNCFTYLIRNTSDSYQKYLFNNMIECNVNTVNGIMLN